MRTVGVDLAVDPANTGLCIVDWAEPNVVLLDRPVDDAHIVDAIAQCDMAAVDVPLGWPDAFVDAVVAHRAGAPWPPIDAEPPRDREPLRLRMTDLVTRATGAQPLSVSTDRIGVAAMRGARLQHLLGAAGVLVDRSGTSGAVAEGYPAGALRGWGLISSGYKGTKNVETLRLLADAITERCGPLAGEAARALHDRDDHDLDAFLYAVIARAVTRGKTSRPTADQLSRARREGWIHLPTTSLQQIVLAEGGEHLMALSLRVIGTIRTRHTSFEHTPVQAALNIDDEGTIELDPRYVTSLDGLAEFTHAWLLTWLGPPDGDAPEPPLTQVPFLLGRQPRELGVFAMRGPRRPNPIGLSLVRIVAIDEARIRFGGVDMVDRTPLLDLKPYVARLDQAAGDVRCGWFDTITFEQGVTPARLQRDADE